VAAVRRSLAAILSVQFPRFLIAGGLAASANFGSRFLFSEFFSFEVAVVLAFCVGLSCGFLLNKNFVFANSRNRIHLEVGYYLLINLLALVQTWLLSVYGSRFLAAHMELGLAQAAAHLAGIMFPVISSYFGHKYLTFRERASSG
jgi:putative flippase GtrA